MYFSLQRGSVFETFALGVLTALFLIGLVEAITARVVLGSEFIEIVSNFRRRRVRRSEILRVVAERGAPPALELRSGGWLKLPFTRHRSPQHDSGLAETTVRLTCEPCPCLAQH
jgi:hypothetical protein